MDFSRSHKGVSGLYRCLLSGVIAGCEEIAKGIVSLHKEEGGCVSSISSPSDLPLTPPQLGGGK